MHINRRDFFTKSAAAGAMFARVALAAGKADYAAPDYEAPLFNLHKFSSTPIRIRSIELLRNGDHFFVRSTSTDGAVGISKTKQIEDYAPVFTRRVAPFFTGKDVRDLETLIDGVYAENYKMAGQGFWLPVASAEQSLKEIRR